MKNPRNLICFKKYHVGILFYISIKDCNFAMTLLLNVNVSWVEYIGIRYILTAYLWLTKILEMIKPS